MKVYRCVKDSFAVIGKEGSTNDGGEFIRRLWTEANTSFSEVESVAKRDQSGRLIGIWGAMTDFSRSFQPWQNNFSCGLYLAGIECECNAETPAGWTKWIVPGFEYLYTECRSTDTFREMIQYLDEQGLKLKGAVQDFICPQTGKNYMYFPIRRL